MREINEGSTLFICKCVVHAKLPLEVTIIRLATLKSQQHGLAKIKNNFIQRLVTQSI